MLHQESVLPSTLDLLKNLQVLPQLSGLRLVGGTALAFLLGHRASIDIDLFGTFDSNLSLRKIIADTGRTVDGPESGSILALKVDGVKVDLVNYPYPWLEDPIVSGGVVLAGLRDIAAMKLSAVANRGRKKDFIDIACLLDMFGLDEILEFYKQKFSVSDVAFPLRGLMFFDDAEDDPMPQMLLCTKTWPEIKDKIVKAVRDVVF